jgi:hypothetical protein
MFTAKRRYFFKIGVCVAGQVYVTDNGIHPIPRQ